MGQVSPVSAAVLDEKTGKALREGIDYVSGEVLVKFKQGTPKAKTDKHHKDADAEILFRVSKLEVEQIKSKRGESTEALLKRYKKNPDVEYAEPNILGSVASSPPNDPGFPLLYGLHNIGQTRLLFDPPTGTSDADIDALEAWNVTTGSSNIIVADIDTGVEYTHEDMKANMWKNTAEFIGVAGIDDDGNGYTDDVYGWDFANNDPDPMDDHSP